MSSPHPEGRGARAAMLQALASAGLTPEHIDYSNLHGTGTPSNDSAEGKAVAAVFAERGPPVPVSSTKGATGHTLGAAGALEAVICALALRHGFLPGSANTQRVDPALGFEYLRANSDRAPARALSNSFGFGGSNCALILGRGG
jgi:3-oxoacyl-[acyl-carrier-protein] synthase-1